MKLMHYILFLLGVFGFYGLIAINSSVEKKSPMKFSIGELVIHRSNNHFPMVVCKINSPKKYWCRWLDEYGDFKSEWYNEFELLRSTKNDIPAYRYVD